jgi:hypothetical protein
LAFLYALSSFAQRDAQKKLSRNKKSLWLLLQKNIGQFPSAAGKNVALTE